MTNSRNPAAGYLIKCGGCCGFSLCDQYGAENKNLCWGDNTLQIESGDNKIRLKTPRNGGRSDGSMGLGGDNNKFTRLTRRRGGCSFVSNEWAFQIDWDGEEVKEEETTRNV